MRLVQVPSVMTRPKPRRSTIRVYVKRLALLLLSLVVVSEVGLYFRPLPAATINITVPESVKPGEATLVWPTVGQATISAERYSFLLSNTASTTVSTASMAKLLTALCILEVKPLAADQAGPTITMHQADVDRYQQEVDQGGSYLPIVLGETLTERQLLEAMLLPSANNIANSAAIWAFGSLSQYQTYAKNYVQKHGLNDTVIGSDASGFDPATKSTTADLTKLAKLALAVPTVVAIAKEQRATFTTAGTVENRNYLLSNGILTGLKTGMNDGNTGGFVFTANVIAGAKTYILTGAIANDTGSLDAVRDAEALAKSATDDFETITLAKHTSVGTIKTAWGEQSPLITERAIAVTRWKTNRAYYYDRTASVSGLGSKKVGDLYIKTDGGSDQTPIIEARAVTKPSIWWRLTTVR